jgi:hypothetical protein
MKERNHSEDLGKDRLLIREFTLGKLDGKVWSGCIWLRIETNGALL